MKNWSKLLVIGIGIFMLGGCGGASSDVAPTNSTETISDETAEEEISSSENVEETVETTEMSVAETSEEVESETYSQVYNSGMYKTGLEIPAGEYVIFSDNEIGGYFELSSDSSGNSLVKNGAFRTFTIYTIPEGDYYFKLDTAYAVPFDEVTSLDTSGPGMWKVGTHIPAGEYKLEQTGEYGAYLCVYSDSTQVDIVTNNSFNNNAYITVQEGQYLMLEECKIVSWPNNEDNNNSTETSETSQSTLSLIEKSYQDTLDYVDKQNEGKSWADGIISQDVRYREVIARLDALQSKMNDGAALSEIEEEATSLFGQSPSSIEEVQQWHDNVRGYLTDEEIGPCLDYLMSKIKDLPEVEGTIEPKKVDITIKDIDAFLKEMTVSPETFGQIWAVTDCYAGKTEFADEEIKFVWTGSEDFRGLDLDIMSSADSNNEGDTTDTSDTSDDALGMSARNLNTMYSVMSSAKKYTCIYKDGVSALYETSTQKFMGCLCAYMKYDSEKEEYVAIEDESDIPDSLLFGLNSSDNIDGSTDAFADMVVTYLQVWCPMSKEEAFDFYGEVLMSAKNGETYENDEYTGMVASNSETLMLKVTKK